MTIYDNINIEIPSRFMSKSWQTISKRKAKVNVGFNYENQQLQIVHYFATSSHKSIKWTAELYEFLEQQCVSYVKLSIHGMHQAKEIGDLPI